MDYATAWHCTGTLITTVLTEDCVVTAVSTSKQATTTIVSDIKYHDWLFVQMWILFLLAMVVFGMWFSWLKPQK